MKTFIGTKTIILDVIIKMVSRLPCVTQSQKTLKTLRTSQQTFNYLSRLRQLSYEVSVRVSKRQVLGFTDNIWVGTLLKNLKFLFLGRRKNLAVKFGQQTKTFTMVSKVGIFAGVTASESPRTLTLTFMRLLLISYIDVTTAFTTFITLPLTFI